MSSQVREVEVHLRPEAEKPRGIAPEECAEFVRTANATDKYRVSGHERYFIIEHYTHGTLNDRIFVPWDDVEAIRINH